MPVYNHVAWCGAALRSILNQTVDDLRVLAVDDGSTDGSLDALQEAAGGDRRVTVLRRPHAGIVGALNAGLAESNAEFVARMDSDDISLPARLERELALLSSDRRLGAVDCRVTLAQTSVTGDGMRTYVDWLNSLGEWAQIRAALFQESPLAHPAVLMRSEALNAAGGYLDVSGPEDYSLWLRMVEKGFGLAKVPETLFEWRDLPERLTRTSPRYSPEQWIGLKVRHLPTIHPRASGPLQLWGAGPSGRRFLRAALSAGLDVQRVFDIDPKRIGSTLHGLPILVLDRLLVNLDCLTLVALGTRTAKAQVRTWAAAHALTEWEDYLFVS